MNCNPIYVAGQERSGTSLMFALLTSHPNIAMTRRTNLWTHFYNQYGDLSEPDNFERCLYDMMRYNRLVVLKPDPDRLRQDFWQGEPTYDRLFGLLETQHAERMNKPRWGDKSLHTERYAEPIFTSFPSATILHMMRDPRDRFASSLSRWKKIRGGVGTGTAKWLDSEKLARINLKRHPDQYKIVRYERLAMHPERTLREICAFIGEDYTPTMLEMEESGSFFELGGNSSYGRREPGVISTDSIGRFRQILSQRQIAFIQEHAAQPMIAMGYDPDPIHLSWSERLIYTLADQPLNLARMVAWRTRESIRDRQGRPIPSYRIVANSDYKSV